jgi:hypothetical protein
MKKNGRITRSKPRIEVQLEATIMKFRWLDARESHLNRIGVQNQRKEKKETGNSEAPATEVH